MENARSEAVTDADYPRVWASRAFWECPRLWEAILAYEKRLEAQSRALAQAVPPLTLGPDVVSSREARPRAPRGALRGRPHPMRHSAGVGAWQAGAGGHRFRPQ